MPRTITILVDIDLAVLLVTVCMRLAHLVDSVSLSMSYSLTP